MTMTREEFGFHFRQHRGAYAATAMFVLVFALYIVNHQRGWTVPVITTAANKGVLLAIVAMAQTLPVLTSGIDLSVGMVFVLANCVASHLVVGTPLQAALGCVAVLVIGALCGLVNGLIIVYGRLQPIITTLATGTIYYGISLGLRPVPGGAVQTDIADALTGAPLFGIPSLLLVLAMVVLCIWVPYRRSAIGRAALAIGSAEAAAYMSGVPIGRAIILTYTLAGLLAAIGASAIGWALARFAFEFDYTISPWVFALGIGGGALCALAGGYLGLRGVLKTPPLATLREA
jgi:ribose transport system permease protein